MNDDVTMFTWTSLPSDLVYVECRASSGAHISLHRWSTVRRIFTVLISDCLYVESIRDNFAATCP